MASVPADSSARDGESYREELMRIMEHIHAALEATEHSRIALQRLIEGRGEPIAREGIPDLPSDRRFPMYTQITVFLPEQLGGGSQIIAGTGYLHYLFEPTELRNETRVRLMDIAFDGASIDIQLDIDGDGETETIETGEIALRMEDFNAEESIGMIDLETGEISMTFALSMRPEAIPLFQRFGIEPAPIQIHEKGSLDVRTGDFETHAETFPLVFQMPNGNSVRFLVKGGQFTKCNPGAVSVDLSVNVNFPYSFPTRPGVEEVWICEGEGVRLSWTTGVNVESMTLSPGNIQIKKSDLGKHPGPPGERIIKGIKSSTVFLVTATGCIGTDSETKASDWVVVNVVPPKSEFHRNAERNQQKYPKFPESWVLNLPPDEYSPSIRVRRIKVHSPAGFCAYHWKWNLIKSDPTGPPKKIPFSKPFDPATKQTGWTSVQPGKFPLAWHYEFRPDGGFPPQQHLCLIFGLADCTKVELPPGEQP
jgi:hypothetical protein